MTLNNNAPRMSYESIDAFAQDFELLPRQQAAILSANCCDQEDMYRSMLENAFQDYQMHDLERD